MKTYQGPEDWPRLRASLETSVDTGGLARLEQAWQFATAAHRGQRRPAGDAYAQHLSEVVRILADTGVTNPDLLVAGVLHDVLEDTDVSRDELAQRFGAKVAELVEQLTQSQEAAPGPQEAAPGSADARARYLGRFRDAPLAVQLVKLADRYSNVQRLHTHPRVGKQRSYYAETREHFFPIAARQPGFAELYQEWADAYEYLAEDAVDTLLVADQVAAAYHRGQTDKSGHPYIGHPRAVAGLVQQAGGSLTQQMAGLLHDTVEDTAATLDSLRELGVPADVLTLVDALTHRPGEAQPGYLARIVDTPGATDVKRADIAHNASPARLSQLDPETQRRLSAKYAAATAILDQR